MQNCQDNLTYLVIDKGGGGLPQSGITLSVRDKTQYQILFGGKNDESTHNVFPIISSDT